MPKKSLKKFPRELILPLIIILAIVSLAVVCVVWVRENKTAAVALPALVLETRPITVGSAKLTAEVAATDDEQRQGLSDRSALGANVGMVFPLPSPAKPGFWMNRMNFPLDFIYLNAGRVVELKENVPNNDLTPFFPSVLVDAVLEVNAGYIAEHGISVGDEAGY